MLFSIAVLLGAAALGAAALGAAALGAASCEPYAFCEP